MKLQDAVLQIIAAMDELDLDYMLVGSFSSMYYSFPRSTTDADFVIGTPGWDVRLLAERLGKEFKFDPQISFEMIGGSIKNEIEIEGTPFRIELFGLNLQKLIWFRPKDQEDVLGVIAVNHDLLDQDYLRQCVDQLGLTEAFDNAWALAIES